MILVDPRKAIGYKLRWCRWPKDQHFVIESISIGNGKMRGKLYDNNRVHKRTYNVMKGITTGKKMTDYWYLLDWNTYKLDDELFEI